MASFFHDNKNQNIDSNLQYQQQSTSSQTNTMFISYTLKNFPTTLQSIPSAMNDCENIFLVYYSRKKEIFTLDSLSMTWYKSQLLIPNRGNLDMEWVGCLGYNVHHVCVEKRDNYIVIVEKLCLNSENICDKIVIMNEIIKLSVNNKIFTNEMKIIIGIKAWNIRVYLKRENKCNGSLKFWIHSFPFIECVPNNENIWLSDVIRFI